MRSTTFYNELKSLCQHVYKTPTQDLAGWVYQEQATSKDGLFVAIYTKGSDTAFVIRGSEDGADYLADVLLQVKRGRSQFSSAYIYYLKIKAKYPNIIFTGHSLGGAIAQYLGTITGLETVTFEAYGIADVFSANYIKNVINYGNLYDPVFLYKLEYQIGKCMILNIGNRKISFKWHSIENMGNIATAKELHESPIVLSLYQFLRVALKDSAVVFTQKVLEWVTNVNDSLFVKLDISHKI